LPWQGIRVKKKEVKYQKIFEKKINTRVEEICKDLPEEFIKFLEYVRDLQFEQKPDYGYLKEILGKIYVKNNIKYDGVYDYTFFIEKKEKIDMEKLKAKKKKFLMEKVKSGYIEVDKPLESEIKDVNRFNYKNKNENFNKINNKNNENNENFNNIDEVNLINEKNNEFDSDEKDNNNKINSENVDLNLENNNNKNFDKK